MQTYEGAFEHPDFQTASVAIAVTLEPTGNGGFWVTLGQEQLITVEWGENNSILFGELGGVTKLKGTVDQNGTISGTVIHQGREGGHFELHPLVARDEVHAQHRVAWRGLAQHGMGTTTLGGAARHTRHGGCTDVTHAQPRASAHPHAHVDTSTLGGGHAPHGMHACVSIMQLSTYTPGTR